MFVASVGGVDGRIRHALAMTILYYAPLSCSLASRIACLESGSAVSFRRVDLGSRRVHEDADFLRYNPMGKVPTLVLDGGTVLTENAAVLTYLADCAPESGLAPPSGSLHRYELLKWLSFVATELHRRVTAQIFALDSPPEGVKEYARRAAAQPLSVLESHLRDRRTLLGGDAFTVADAYLFWALAILPFAGVSMDPYPELQRYRAEHARRQAVSEALSVERTEYASAPYAGGVS
jgi:glutathione S-transferase